MDWAIGMLLTDANIFGIYIQYWMIVVALFFALWVACEMVLSPIKRIK